MQRNKIVWLCVYFTFVLVSVFSSFTVKAKGNMPELIPNCVFLQKIVQNQMDILEPSVWVESLELYQKPSGISVTFWTKEEQKNLLNAFLALSTLKGLKYFSKTKGEIRVLYEESEIIDNPQSKKGKPDPVYAALPDSLTIYARQTDSTFGSNIYRYQVYCLPEAFVFIQENLTSMNFGLLPLIGKNRLRSVIAVLDAGEYLQIYVISMTKASPAPWMEKRVKDSFANRTVALMSWFNNQANKAYAPKRREQPVAH